MTKHILALDGLRAISILFVVAFHTLHVPGGHFGVDVFFVISGFVNTRLLLIELDTKGRFSIGRFLQRRAVRLFPCLIVVVGLTLLFCTLAHVGVVLLIDFITGFFALLFLTNYLMMAMGPVYNLFTHTWSLALEGQFYLLWPLALSLLVTLNRRRLFGCLIAAIVAAVIWRAALWAGGAPESRLQYGLDTHVDQLLAGCLAAFIFTGGATVSLVRRSSLFGLSALAGLFLVCLLAPGTATVRNIILPPVVGVLSTILILDLLWIPDGLLARLLSTKIPVYIGTVSYGFYLWHDVVNHFVLESSFNSPISRVLFSGVGGFLAAAISYTLIETPIQKMVARRQSDAPRVTVRAD